MLGLELEVENDRYIFGCYETIDWVSDNVEINNEINQNKNSKNENRSLPAVSRSAEVCTFIAYNSI